MLDSTSSYSVRHEHQHYPHAGSSVRTRRGSLHTRENGNKRGDQRLDAEGVPSRRHDVNSGSCGGTEIEKDPTVRNGHGERVQRSREVVL